MRFKFHLLILISFVAVIFLSTCTSEVATPNICFQEDVLPLFVSNCTQSGCHNATDKVAELDLGNYTGIMKSIKANHPFQSESFTTINSGSMPPSRKFTKYEKDIIKHWIKAGAPNSSNCNSCDTTYTYSNRIQPMMNKWCVGCHATGNAGGGYDLSTYDNIVLSIANNKLNGSIQHQPGYSEMPKNGGKLSDCDLAAMSKWLNAGHPKN